MELMKSVGRSHHCEQFLQIRKAFNATKLLTVTVVSFKYICEQP